jgi:biopolymer transport protein ExbB
MRLTAVFVIAMLAAAAPASAPHDGDAPTATSSTESFAEAFFLSRITHASGEKSIDFVGTTLLWLLLMMSLVNIGLIGQLSLANQRNSILPRGVQGEVRRLLVGGDYRRALDVTRTDPSYFGQILHSGLKESSHGFAAVMRAIEQTADMLATARMRPIEILYMFGQISPMMGLLGTVYGIIFSFKVFVSMGGRASPALLASGIGTALVATFWGLVVAIPALAAYSLLRNKVDQLTMEAIVAAENMVSHFKPRGASASGPVAAPAASAVPGTPGAPGAPGAPSGKPAPKPSVASAPGA